MAMYIFYTMPIFVKTTKKIFFFLKFLLVTIEFLGLIFLFSIIHWQFTVFFF